MRRVDFRPVDFEFRLVVGRFWEVRRLVLVFPIGGECLADSFIVVVYAGRSSGQSSTSTAFWLVPQAQLRMVNESVLPSPCPM